MNKYIAPSLLSVLLIGKAPALTEEAVQSAFDQHRDNLYRIYNKSLATDPLISGCADYRLIIKPDGSLTEAPSFTSSKITSASLLKEISSYIFENISFPMEPSDKTIIKVIYPICFHSLQSSEPLPPVKAPSKEAEDWLKSILEEEAKKKASKNEL